MNTVLEVALGDVFYVIAYEVKSHGVVYYFKSHGLCATPDLRKAHQFKTKITARTIQSTLVNMDWRYHATVEERSHAHTRREDTRGW